MLQITTQQKNELIQDVLDRILYCDDYIEALKAFNKNYNPHTKTKFTRNTSEFKFPLHTVIT